MVKRYVFGCLFGLLLIAGIGALSGALGGSVDIPSLAIVLGLPFAAVFISHGPVQTGKAIKHAFENDGSTTPVSELKRAKVCIKALDKYLVVSTVLASIYGAIGIFGNLPDRTVLGSYFAVLLVTTLYVTVLILLFTAPLMARLEDRIISATAE